VVSHISSGVDSHKEGAGALVRVEGESVTMRTSSSVRRANGHTCTEHTVTPNRAHV
jgi:hypothetical protein